MGPITVAAVTALALACHAPGVNGQRIIAHAVVESGLDRLAVHDNTTQQSYRPATPVEAMALASRLVTAGHSIDAGLMQINSAGWARLGLSAITVFNPQLNVCAGATILAEATATEHRISCRYNAGRPDCGSDYPAKIDQAMQALSDTLPIRAHRRSAEPPLMSVFTRPAPARELVVSNRGN